MDVALTLQAMLTNYAAMLLLFDPLTVLRLLGNATLTTASGNDQALRHLAMVLRLYAVAMFGYGLPAIFLLGCNDANTRRLGAKVYALGGFAHVCVLQFMLIPSTSVVGVWVVRALFAVCVVMALVFAFYANVKDPRWLVGQRKPDPGPKQPAKGKAASGGAAQPKDQPKDKKS